MSTRYDQDIKSEIDKYNRYKVICIVTGILIAVACIIGIIFLSITIQKTLYDAQEAYLADEISYQEFVRLSDSTIVLSFLQTALGFGITGGAALAVAGGIVNSVKAKNRAKRQKRRDLAEDYGGNGVEF